MSTENHTYPQSTAEREERYRAISVEIMELDGETADLEMTVSGEGDPLWEEIHQNHQRLDRLIDERDALEVELGEAA